MVPGVGLGLGQPGEGMALGDLKAVSCTCGEVIKEIEPGSS